MTDDFQPLNRYLFRVMNLNYRRCHWQFCRANSSAKVDQPSTAAFLLRELESVGPRVIDWADPFVKSRIARFILPGAFETQRKAVDRGVIVE
jgi:hypothetical protein